MTWRLRDPTGFVWDIAGTAELELLPNLLRPGTTSVFDIGDATHVLQGVHQEIVYIYRTDGANFATMFKGATNNLTITETTGSLFLNGQIQTIIQAAGATRFIVAPTYIEARLLFRPEPTSAIDIGEPTKVFRKLHIEEVDYYDILGDDHSPNYQKSVLTANAVPTNIDSIVMADNTRIYVETKIIGMQDDGTEGVLFHIAGFFKRDGAGAVQIGITKSIDTDDTEQPLCDADYTVNVNNIEPQVTGVAAEDWVWTSKTEYTVVD